MLSLERVLNPEARLGRAGFITACLVLAAIIYVSYEVSHFLVMTFLEHDPEHAFLGPLGNFGGIVAAVICLCAGTILLIRRLRDMGKRGILTLWMLVPVVNLALLAYALVAPSASEAD